MNESPLTNVSPSDAAGAAKSWEMYTAPTASVSKTLVIIGEAPGADEEKAGIPFVGSAGRQLTEAFTSAGLDRSEWHILNTFVKRPPENNLNDPSWTLNKTEYKKAYGHAPTSSPLNSKKRYLRPEHQWQVAELYERLRVLQPDLILAMGATALWALTSQSAITQFRGTFFDTAYGRAIATLHPASVLYQYSNLPFLWADLTKVRLFLEDKLPSSVRRRLWINPTFAEIADVYRRFAASAERIGVDIETCPPVDQITTVAFSTPTEGVCIPIWDRYADSVSSQNYWPETKDELEAWKWIRRFAQLSNAKAMQNGMYDSQYLLDAPLEVRLKNWTDDTLLIQHSYQPELKKDLGTLSSLYLNEPSWKQMRKKASDTNKADE